MKEQTDVIIDTLKLRLATAAARVLGWLVNRASEKNRTYIAHAGVDVARLRDRGPAPGLRRVPASDSGPEPTRQRSSEASIRAVP